MDTTSKLRPVLLAVGDNKERPLKVRPTLWPQTHVCLHVYADSSNLHAAADPAGVD